MAHFARVEDSIVTIVIVIRNEDMLDANGHESETIGQEYCARLFGTDPGVWIQCSYNAAVNGFRGAYPAPGFLWDGNVFYLPQSDIE